MHDWEDADCTTPKTCDLCGETKGKALGHVWKDATCTEKKTCSVCAATEGETLSHTVGEWETASSDAVKATEVKVKKCTVCNREIERKDEILTKLHDENLFLMSPSAFAERCKLFLRQLGENDATVKITEISGALAVKVEKGYLFGGAVFFNHGGEGIDPSQNDDVCYDGVELLFYRDDMSLSTNLMIALVMTCDPSVTETEARSLVSSLLDDTYNHISKNGLAYEYMYSTNSSYLAVAILI